MTENGWDDHFADDRSRVGYKGGKSGRNVSPSASNNFLRHSILRVSENKRAKKVRFYRNGDRFFKGMLYAVSAERFRTFESLLAELTSSPLCDKNVLPQGVRYIFSVDSAKIITNLDQLEEGESYVCASTDIFRDIEYHKSVNPNWNVNAKAREAQEQTPTSPRDLTDEDKGFIKPKLVTVIRNGSKPRKAVRIVLNKKTAHSFSQVLDDITEAIKLDSGSVKKIFTVDGRQVTCLSDFFQDETIFIAYGAEKCSMEDFDLDQKEVRLVSGYKANLSQSRERITLRSPKTPRKSSSSRSLHEVGLESPNRSRTSSPKSPRKLRTVSAPKYRNGTSNGSSSLPNSPKTTRRSAGKTRLPDELTERYEVGVVIGEGNFAVVKECIDRFNNRRFALKIIDKTRCQGKEEKMIENEVSILRKVKHPNIILLVEEFDTRDSLFMVMELVKGGDLFDAISTSTKYTERDASGMIYNLAGALKYLHSLNIVHRDIKPENLLVCDHGDDSKSLKLGDFGLATVVDDVMYTVCGTPTYVAPEILAESGYGLKIDVWSAGVITYILLCGFPPFFSAKDNQEELFDKILEGKFEFKQPYWDDVSESAKDLITNMLVVDPDQRFTAEQVLTHPWVASDTARDEDIHDNIAKTLNNHFEQKTKRKPDTAGIRLITSTALDKGSRYFQGRGGATFTLHARGNSCHSDDEDEIF
ncbi:serine/threonine-protein kinase DCLK1 [Patella vulgata]|uniref:serine/threonine-protein kinase DCLK1 n=1 Tax=Patella vulgata TaxID=6465 RepID=UPI00218016AD|nr:serine/threonine-protein kinase DCLK1 [Patella vulgata]